MYITDVCADYFQSHNMVEEYHAVLVLLKYRDDCRKLYDAIPANLEFGNFTDICEEEEFEEFEEVY